MWKSPAPTSFFPLITRPKASFCRAKAELQEPLLAGKWGTQSVLPPSGCQQEPGASLPKGAPQLGGWWPSAWSTRPGRSAPAGRQEPRKQASLHPHASQRVQRTLQLSGACVLAVTGRDSREGQTRYLARALSSPPPLLSREKTRSSNCQRRKPGKEERDIPVLQEAVAEGEDLQEQHCLLHQWLPLKTQYLYILSLHISRKQYPQQCLWRKRTRGRVQRRPSITH